MIIIFFVPFFLMLNLQSAFAVAHMDLKFIKEAQGEYELTNHKMNKEKRKLCSDGELVFDDVAGTISLGTTVLATNVFEAKNQEDSELKDKTLDPQCEEVSNVTLNNKTLVYDSKTKCKKEEVNISIHREFKFAKKNAITYRQRNLFNGQKTDVTCKLVKVEKKGAKEKWKIESEVVPAK